MRTLRCDNCTEDFVWMKRGKNPFLCPPCSEMVSRCSTCKQCSPRDNFHKDGSASSGLSSKCKPCAADAMVKQFARTPPRRRKAWELRRYGISMDQWQEMLEAQHGACAICEDDMPSPCVDHDHVTGAVRGLLCVNCNFAIGQMKDDPDRLVSAAAYLLARAGGVEWPSSEPVTGESVTF